MGAGKDFLIEEKFEIKIHKRIKKYLKENLDIREICRESYLGD